MQKFIMPAAIPVIALLAACNGGAGNNSSANAAAAANTAVAAPAPTPTGPGAAPAPAGGVDQAFIVGHWAPDPGCDETITFEADGTARVSDDPRPGRWALAGDTLTVTPPEGPAQPAQVGRSGDNLVATQSGRPPMTMIRCQTPAAQEKAG